MEISFRWIRYPTMHHFNGVVCCQTWLNSFVSMDFKWYGFLKFFCLMFWPNVIFFDQMLYSSTKNYMCLKSVFILEIWHRRNSKWNSHVNRCKLCFCTFVWLAFVVLLYMSCRCKLGCIHRVVLYTRVTQTYSFIIYFQIGNRQTLIQGIIKQCT